MGAPAPLQARPVDAAPAPAPAAKPSAPPRIVPPAQRPAYVPTTAKLDAKASDAGLDPSKAAPKLDGKMDAKLDAKMDGKLDAKLDGKDKGGAQSAANDPGKPGDAPRAPGTKAAAAKGKPGAKVARGEAGAAGSVAAPIAVPVADTGRHALARAALVMPTASARLDAPTALDVHSTAPAAKDDAKNPTIAQAPAAFTRAAATAAALHAEIVADAARTADATRDAEASRFERAQSGLDRALVVLDSGLGDARSLVDREAQAALLVVDGHARAARSSITRAAGGARQKLKAAAKTLRSDFEKPAGKAERVEKRARAKTDTILKAGTEAAEKVAGLAAAPESADMTGNRMRVAQGETIVVGMPPRAERRAKNIAEQVGVHKEFLVGPINKLHNDMALALQDFHQMVANADIIGPDAVERARAGAIAQLDATVAQLTQAITAARLSTEAALVKQHAQARQQLIDGAEAETRGARTAASAQGSRDVEQQLSLARGQGGAVKALAEGFEGERKRSRAEFATVVTRGAAGLAGRLQAQARLQRPLQAQSAASGRAALDREVLLAAARYVAGARASAEGITAIAGETGRALVPQAEEGCAGLKKLAGPISGLLKNYLPPLEKTGAAKVAETQKAVDAAEKSINGAFDGTGGGDAATGDGAAKPGTPPADPGKTVAKPEDTPNDFGTNAGRTRRNPKQDTLIKEFIAAAMQAVLDDVLPRKNTLKTELGHLRSDVDVVQEQLRGLTFKRGDAIKQLYGPNLEAHLTNKLTKWLSSGETNDANVAQALNNLNGYGKDAALYEMKAATGWWNDTKRFEKAFRALTPAQIRDLDKGDGKAKLDAIRLQLQGVDREVFDKLRAAGADETKLSDANALRLKEAIDKGRGTRGEEGGNATFKAFEDAEHAAGKDALARNYNRPLDAGVAVGDTLGNKLQAERAGVVWQASLKQFDTVAPPGKDAPAQLLDINGKPYKGPGASAYAYAIASRTYSETRRKGKEDFETKFYVEGLSTPQAKSIEALLVYGADAIETKGARLAVLRSQGVKPDPKKVDAIMHDTSLDARPGEAFDPAKQREREKAAIARYDELYKAYEKYSRPAGEKERDVGKVKDELVAWAEKGHEDDKGAKAYVSSMLKSPVADTTAAFNYALDGWGNNTDLLKQTFGRMNHSQIVIAVDDYNAKHPNGPSLYARLGIFGQSNFFSELSGDKKNDVELAAMGVPENDRDKFQVARMALKQQRDQASWLSSNVLASDEFDAMVDNMDVLRKQGGFTAAEFENNFGPDGRLLIPNPATGEKINGGNFGPKGEFLPPAKGDTNAFNSAVIMAHLNAANYKDATDRIANFVTTAIVVAAAIISTALTAGAAASIWIPVLVTAGAGLVGMSANYLIKGDRYGRDDIAHDLAMTVIQAATAGLGAAAGAVMKGGMPALRAAAGAWKIEKAAVDIAVAEQALIAAGKMAEGTAEQAAKRAAIISLGKTLSIGQEMVIGGGSAAFANTATAMIDSDAWREGRYGANIFHSFAGGALGGSLGAGAASLGTGAVNKLAGVGRSALRMPPLKPGDDPHWSVALMTRVGGSASAGFTQSFAEGGYRAIATGKEVKLADLVSEGSWAAVQNVAQSVGEHGAEKAAHANAAHPDAHPGKPAPHAANDREPPASTRPTPHAVDEPATAKPAAKAEPVRTAAPAHEAPLPAKTGPPAHAERDAPAPRTAHETEPAPAARRPGEPEPAAKSGARTPDPDAEAHGRPAAGHTPANDGERPRPGPHGSSDDGVEHIEHWPDHTVVTDARDPRSPHAAAANYHELIQAQRGMEVAIYYNHATGEYAVVQGNDMRFHGILLEGGPWTIEAHYHPLLGDSTATPMWLRMPSGRGGDMDFVRHDSRSQGGGPRESRIDYLVDGRYMSTTFGYDPAGGSAKYWIRVDTVHGAPPEYHAFASLEAYGEFYENRFGGSPHVDEPAHGAAPRVVAGDPVPASPAVVHHPANDTAPGLLHHPGSAPAPPTGAAPAGLTHPDEFVFYHGTSTKGQDAIAAAGVVANRGAGKGKGDDFGAAFYVTPQEHVGQTYASERVRRDNLPGGEAVLKFTVSREAMGVIVDIRPGGQHRAAFEAYMNGPSPFANNPNYKHLPQTMGEYLGTFGHDRRGQHFEEFLGSVGMSHADAVFGDLGGIGTRGIGAQHPGAEQIAIRSQRLADLLTAQLPGGAAIARTPVAPPAGGSRPPRPPKAGAPLPPEDFVQQMRKPRTPQEIEEMKLPPHKRTPDAEIDAFVDGWHVPADVPEKTKMYKGKKSKRSEDDITAIKTAAKVRQQELTRLRNTDPQRHDRLMLALDAGSMTVAQAVEAFRTARAADPDAAGGTIGAARAKKDAAALKALLEVTQTKRSAEQKAMKAIVEAAMTEKGISPAVRNLVLKSPALIEMYHQNQVIGTRRLKRMAGRYRGANFTTENFDAGWVDYYAHHQKSATSEHDALFHFGDDGLDVLKGGGRGNKHGIDAIVVERPKPGDPPSTLAKVKLVDDKAFDAESLSSVSALTEHLQKNLAKDGKALKTALDDHAKKGVVDPLHYMAANQMIDAAAAIAAIKHKPAKGTQLWDDPAYAAKVQKILRDHGIELWITSARGNVQRLSTLLGPGGYGFEIQFNQYTPPPEAPPAP